MSQVKEQTADYQLADLSPALKTAEAGNVLLESLPVWLSAQTRKSAGRGRSAGNTLQYGVQKLRELILELAVRGKLVEQDPSDEPASVMLKKIAEEKVQLIKTGKIKKQKPLDNLSDDEYFFVAPETWAWARLGNIGFTQTGGTPSKSKKEYFGIDIPFIKPADIYPGKVDYDNEGLSHEGAESLARLAPSGSILMVCIGTIGKCNLVSKDVCFNQQINSVTPLSVVSEYLLIALRSNQFQAEAWNRSSSTTIAILNKGKWESIPVPLPPLTEQHRIVKKVDELMALCDQLEQQQVDAVQAHDTLVKVLLDTLTQSENAEDFQQNWRRIAEYFDTLFTTESSIDQLKQTLLQLAVMGKLVPQDPNDEPASVLLKKISEEKAQSVKERNINKQNPFAEVREDEQHFNPPIGWQFSRLGNLTLKIGSGSTPRGGKNAYVNSGIPFLRSQNVWNHGLELSDVAYISASTHKKMGNTVVSTGDILLNITGASIGRCTIYPDDMGESNVSQHVTIIRPVNLRTKEFLHLFIQSPICQALVWGRQVGMAREGLSKKVLEQFEIPLPPLAEQHRIVKKVDELMALCDHLKDRLNQAQTLQQQLADTVVSKSVYDDCH